MLEGFYERLTVHFPKLFISSFFFFKCIKFLTRQLQQRWLLLFVNFPRLFKMYAQEAHSSYKFFFLSQISPFFFVRFRLI